MLLDLVSRVRWIACLSILVCLSGPSLATGTVACSPDGGRLQVINSCTGSPTPVSGFCLGILSTAVSGGFTNWVAGSTPLNTYAEFRATSYVEPGTACAAGTALVVMTPGDYTSMINGAQVQTELINAENYGLVALLGLIFLMAFAWGWKIVQRGGSQ